MRQNSVSWVMTRGQQNINNAEDKITPNKLRKYVRVYNTSVQKL
jgi:hypothetical protein